MLNLNGPSLRVHNGHNRGHSFWEQVLVINVGLNSVFIFTIVYFVLNRN